MSRFRELGLGRKKSTVQKPETSQPAPSQAVPPKADNTNQKSRRTARNYKINTLVHQEYGFLMEDARRAIRLQTGRNPKIAEVLELAFEALEEKMTGGGNFDHD